MSTILIALPLPPGSTEEMTREFANEVKARLDEFAKSRTDIGLPHTYAWAT